MYSVEKCFPRPLAVFFLFFFYKCVYVFWTHCAGSATHSPSQNPLPRGRARPPAAELSRRRSEGIVSESDECVSVCVSFMHPHAFHMNSACGSLQPWWGCRESDETTVTYGGLGLESESEPEPEPGALARSWRSVTVTVTRSPKHKADGGSLHMRKEQKELWELLRGVVRLLEEHIVCWISTECWHCYYCHYYWGFGLYYSFKNARIYSTLD